MGRFHLTLLLEWNGFRRELDVSLEEVVPEVRQAKPTIPENRPLRCVQRKPSKKQT